MNPLDFPDDSTAQLRRRAELELDGQLDGSLQENPNDPQALVWQLKRSQQELLVHQVELRMQMEQLQQTNLELQQARDEYLDLYDFAPVSYLTFDRTGQILQANLTAARQFALSRESLLRRRLSSLLEPQDVSTFALFLRRVFETGEKRTTELRFVGAHGMIFHAQVECSVSPGETCRAAIIDISAQRRAQEEVLRLNTHLEERVQERTAHIRELSEEHETFVYAVAHDLQVPLRHIRSFTNMFVKHQNSPDEQEARHAQHIVNSVERMEQLLNALLLFFRTSRQRVRFVAVDLNRVMFEVRKDLQSELEGRDVALTSDPLPTVTGDSTTLQLVFSNLLANALKFTRTREAARIHVCVRDTAREHVICVEDNGVGFNMRQKERLFSMFQRLHSERDFEGTGMGLALVRRIVLRHGGRVWAEGKVGQGATFYFSLPKRLPDPE
ncbi:sensor histidine kinase [Deinococcus peraridilitoris]|uniref:histidine kinase n=1 Tax=Deinococcus peraridilitoris (strain DSM 19664 / LMG 22246 / CIP 109416 / KR-200) TaxID=937777 RepID=L0A642_DEIPD|nr:ATP-binding protein [Deinococcus peraridilitoris]AFZ68617.1 PAS domain S-box [Deinococcus peraridilitoris DSM 19664]